MSRLCKDIPGHKLAGGPWVMGVVNVTPDSFSDGGDFYNTDAAIEHGLALIKAGANILDIGGESTRPGATPVEVQEEVRRVIPVIKALAGKGAVISIDTRNADTMQAALSAGANAINDVSALRHDSKSIGVAKEAQVPVFLMHMQGDPQNMQINPQYNNVIDDIYEFLKQRIITCETHGIDADLLCIDPGIGFGKTVGDNLLILRNISKFHDLGVPVLLGASRKSFIGKLSDEEDAGERLGGSLASVIWGLSQGVQIFRVHDVRETVQAFKIYEAIAASGSPS